MKDERLIILLDAYLDGALTSDERKELERILLESDAARREFWSRASLHGWTYQAAKLNHAVEPGTSPARSDTERRGFTFADVAEWLVRWRRRALWGGLAAACVVILAVVAQQWPEREPGEFPDYRFAVDNDFGSGTNSVAMLTRAAGVVWEDPESAANIGSTLWPGWLRLREGIVQIEFYSGARVILEGPAELRLVSSQEAVLRTGRVTAHVPLQARGFKVRSVGVTVVDLGTEFGLAKMPARQPEVHVFSGKVELQPQVTDQPSRELDEGQAIRIGVRTVSEFAADRNAFVTPEVLAEREAAEQQARYEAWKENTRVLSEDPATLVHFTFEEDTQGNRTLVNHSTGARPDAHGGIVGCEWVEGR